MEYLTLSELRQALGESVANASDDTLQMQLDSLTALLENNIGHTFGRAMFFEHTVGATLEVGEKSLIVNGDEELMFADYYTIALVNIALSEQPGFSTQLLQYINPATPSTMLRRGRYQCGAGYAQRGLLTVSGLYMAAIVSHNKRVFLPLPAYDVNWIRCGDVALSLGKDYQVNPNDLWIVFDERWRKRMVEVNYTPMCWLSKPSVFKNLLIEAFRSMIGEEQPDAETFVDYSYRRNTKVPHTWRDLLASFELRPYTVRLNI